MIFRTITAALLFFALLPGIPLAQDSPSENDSPIEVETITKDEAIQERIRDIFEAVGGFENIEIKVQSGVVTLSGEVAKTEVIGDAVSIADRTDGVVLTINRMTEPIEIASQFAPAYERLQEMGRTIVVKLPLIGASLLILILTALISRAVRQQSRWLEKMKVSSLGKELILRIVRLAIYITGILFVLELLDATAIVGAVVGAAGLAGIALGFAFRNIVENYLAGVLLSTRNPFEIGDAVKIDGEEGKVARLTSRDTVLVTLDGNHLRIPNAKVMNSVLLNYSRNPLRRFDFYVGVSTEFDLTVVKALALKTLAENPAILSDPAPMVVVDSLGDSSVVMRFFAWLNQLEHSYLKTKSESIRLIKEAFDQAGIEMPEPIYRLNLQEGVSTNVQTKERPTPAAPSLDLPKREELQEEDLAADRSLDQQIEAEAQDSEEENLLSKSAK